MKYLVFKETEDDRGNELLEQIEVEEDFLSEEEVLVWLANIKGSYVGTRYLIVQPVSWMTAVLKEKPVTTYAHVDGFDPDTVARRKKQDDTLKRAVKLAEGLPADAPAIKDMHT